MRLLRWIVILSSIAYWYSIFAMEAPLGKRGYKEETFWDELANLEGLPVAKKEKFEELPLLELSGPTGLTKADEMAIITRVTKESSIKNAINILNKLLAESDKAQSSNIETIARAVAHKFGTNYLYILSKLTTPVVKNIFDQSLSTITGINFKDDVKQALKSSVAYDDSLSLLRMLSNPFFALALHDTPNYKEQLLASAIDHSKTSAAKTLLEQGAKVTVKFEGKFPIERAKYSPHLIELLEYYDPSNVFTRLIKQNTPQNSTPEYYRKLQTLLDQKALINLESAEINPLLGAASTGNIQLVEWLLAHGANPNLPIYRGNTQTTPRKILQSGMAYPNKQAILDILNKSK